MRAEGRFEVASFRPIAFDPEVQVDTALPVSVAAMEKRYMGAVEGRSATLFTSAFDTTASIGTYVAMESFEGSLDGVRGSFNFVHGASTTGADRTEDHFLIVPSSGTGGLTGIAGRGGMAVDADGTHRIWFEYELG